MLRERCLIERTCRDGTEEQLHRTDGRLWYIPQYRVYHKRKKTIRGVLRLYFGLQRYLFELRVIARPRPYKHLARCTSEVQTGTSSCDGRHRRNVPPSEDSCNGCGLSEVLVVARW